jgi:hypothetical protein
MRAADCARGFFALDFEIMKTKNALMIGVWPAASKVWGCAVLFLGVAAASAQVYVAPSTPPDADSNRDLGFYLNGDLGPSFIPDFQSSRLGFPADFSLHPGARFSVEPGFNFLSTLRLTLGAEAEVGVIYNRFSSVTALSSGATYRGDFYEVPFLGNLVLKIHPGSFVTPYIGVGGGGDFTQVRLDAPGFFGFGTRTRNNEVDPAVQGMAGVRFRINSVSDLGLGYKFLAAFPGEGGYIGTHSVSASFSLRF